MLYGTKTGDPLFLFSSLVSLPLLQIWYAIVFSTPEHPDLLRVWSITIAYLPLVFGLPQCMAVEKISHILQLRSRGAFCFIPGVPKWCLYPWLQMWATRLGQWRNIISLTFDPLVSIISHSSLIAMDLLVLIFTWMQTFKTKRIADQVHMKASLYSMIWRDGQYSEAISLRQLH